MGRACTKSGRKTIPPWLFFALCGYAPRSNDNKDSNWIKAENLRSRFLTEARSRLGKKLKQDPWYAGGGYGSKAGILIRYEPLPKDLKEEDLVKDTRESWMKKGYWDVEGWETERLEKLQNLASFTLLGH